jgi:hypothetical protein
MICYMGKGKLSQARSFASPAREPERAHVSCQDIAGEARKRNVVSASCCACVSERLIRLAHATAFCATRRGSKSGHSLLPPPLPPSLPSSLPPEKTDPCVSASARAHAAHSFGVRVRRALARKCALAGAEHLISPLLSLSPSPLSLKLSLSLPLPPSLSLSISLSRSLSLSLQQVLQNLDELWGEEQYAEAFDVNDFVEKLK